ncbi:MAG: hypothetical protein PHR56_06650 [Dehalococcoidales bacterium]|nr:hypothetical protein [Dehalococcoidales bacterium]
MIADNKKDLESYIIKALGSMQQQGLPPANLLIKTTPENVTLIVRSNDEPVRFGNWTAINISHKDFQSIAQIYEGIVKGRGTSTQLH